MGLEVIIDKIHIINEKLEESEIPVNISDLVIPFSNIFRKNKKPDIYSYNDNLPFSERCSEFQKILYSEFLIE
ncbi:MAG: hypothetical protein ACFFEY_20705 [Candidatus Thorarchaeota archaeon]